MTSLRTISMLVLASLAFAASASAQDSTVTPALLPGVEYDIDRIVAVVGTKPILWSEVMENLNQLRAQGLTVPTDSAGQRAVFLRVLNELIDQEVLVQEAVRLAVTVADAEVAKGVEQHIQRVRQGFPTEEQYRAELVQAGYGTPDEYRRTLTEQARRKALQDAVIQKLRQDGRLVPVGVTEADINAAFESNRASMPRRPATVTFRQIVIAPKPSPEARAAARARADSLLLELHDDADFEQVARRASDDQTTREVGGDLGFNRRGQMVPAFDRMMFSLTPGQISPVVETTFGYHIIRVDRVQPAEVKARHILIRPRLDSLDLARARAIAEMVAERWRAGGNADSLAALYHDPAEERGLLEPYDRTQLPPSYQAALAGMQPGDIAPPFAIENRANNSQKFVVLQLLTAAEGGEYTVQDVRDRIRTSLAQERAIRRLLDSLRRDSYVAIRI